MSERDFDFTNMFEENTSSTENTNNIGSASYQQNGQPSVSAEQSTSGASQTNDRSDIMSVFSYSESQTASASEQPSQPDNEPRLSHLYNVPAGTEDQNSFSGSGQASGYTQNSYGEGDYSRNDNHQNASSYNHPNSYGGFSQKWNYERNQTKAKKNGKGLKIFAVVMSFLFVATLSSFITYYVMYKKADTDNALKKGSSVETSADDSSPITEKISNSPITIIPEIKGDYTGEELSSQEIIKLATPSVVGIKTMVEQNYGWYYGTQTYEGVGSGFIITSDGYVVTNYHVIEDAVSIMVILSNGTEYEAEVIGFDELSDVAVLKVDATDLPALVIGNSDVVIAGDTVIAIGCPSGIDLAGTATRGMVSKVDREISITDYYGKVQKMMKVIQIDAAINPGNSGGPLLNSRGEVIGINTLKLSSTTYEGLGFALPINGVMELVNQICENGAVVERPENSFVTGKAALGITYREITAAESRKYQLPQGVLVVLISQGGAAQNSGIKSGDVIVEFDGEEIETDDKLIELIDSKKPGDEVKVKVYRDGEYKSFDVKLTEASE